MSVTYGFYNSLNGDRTYDATQLSSMFDGLIVDGIFASIGTCFVVNADVGTSINVGIGKAWFNRTWILNDSILPMQAPISEVLLDRIDAVVIEINSSPEVRENSIKFIKGTPSSAPVNPVLANETHLKQYPLCYIYRPAGSDQITQAQITNTVGTASTPFISGILETLDADELFGQWTDQFEIWFQTVKGQLDGDVAGHLYNIKYDKPLRFFDTTVSAGLWVPDAAHSDYGYKADIPLAGVTAAMVPDVVLPLTVATGGEVAPVAQCGAGYVRLYASAVQAEMTIPTITVWRAV